MRSVTCEEIQGYLLAIGVGLTSIAIAVLGGEEAASLAGGTYLLLFPLLTVNGYLMAVGGELPLFTCCLEVAFSET